MIRIGFFGTPELSAQVLKDFLNSEDFEVAFVVTGEDKPIGRHQILTANPVKEVALANSVPLIQPARIRGNSEFLEIVGSYEADYFVVVAYGKILPQELLSIPKKYPINIHGSILPKYRGASPIQAALISGDTKTGVTIMVMNEKMDEGDIIDIHEIAIDPDETTHTLFGKFSEVSGNFAIETIQKLDIGILHPQSQNESQATYCKKISKEEGCLDFTKSAEELYRLYQGFTPWPGIYTQFHNKKLIIERCSYIAHTDLDNIPGMVVKIDDRVGILCNKGILTLSQVKLEGKKSQTLKEFLNGQQDFIGSTLSN